MLWTIAKREFLDSLISLKFALAMILCLGMTTLSFYVLLQDYERRLDEYDSCVAKQDGHPVSMNAIYRKPEILSVFSQGLDRKLGIMIETRVYGGGYVTFVDATGSYAGRQSHYLKSLANVDFAFVIRVVLALVAVFLSYHLISGENESGTLKLSLSNPVPRSLILFGKFLGGTALLIISLTVSLLIGLLIFTLSPTVQLGGEEWVRIGMMYLASILYLICFFSAGALASSLTKTSAASLLIGIVAWICLVFIVPNLTTVLATEVRPIPTKTEMEEKVARFEGLLDSFLRRLPSEDWGPKFADFNRRVQDLHSEYTNRLYNQATFTQRLSGVSPASAFEYASVQLARTDSGTYRNMLSRVREYTREFDKFVLLGTRATHEDYARIMKPSEVSFDMSQTLDRSLSLAMPNILILFLFNAVLFLAAYFAFLRYQIKL